MWFWFLACRPDLPPLQETAYVWQHQWSPAVRDAVAMADFDGLAVLVAEVTWDGRAPVRVQTGTLPPHSTLVLRVAPPPRDPVAVLSPLIADLTQKHPQAAAIQLDLDLPTARLSEYTDWLRRLRAHTELPIEITALPTWLSSADLPALSAAADRLTFQVHWLNPDEPDHLLDRDALTHLHAAARLGRPFSVALPAYGYQVALDGEGALVGIAAEQGNLQVPEGGSVAVVMADPVAVAEVMAAIQADRPDHLVSVSWFRLPVAGDQRVWPTQTLAAVRQGREPVQSMTLTQANDAGAWTLTVNNTGEATLPPPVVAVEGTMLTGDGVGGWRWQPGAGRMVPEHAEAIPPGASVVVGWVRPLSGVPGVRLSPSDADH